MRNREKESRPCRRNRGKENTVQRYSSVRTGVFGSLFSDLLYPIQGPETVVHTLHVLRSWPYVEGCYQGILGRVLSDIRVEPAWMRSAENHGYIRFEIVDGLSVPLVSCLDMGLKYKSPDCHEGDSNSQVLTTLDLKMDAKLW